MSIFFLPDNGNYNPNFNPSPSNYIYVDTNGAGGNGLTPATPTNVVPTSLTNGAQVFFNSDSGIQYMPVSRDNVMQIAGNDVQVASYGSGRAVVAGFVKVTGGWTLEVGTVYSRSWNPTRPNVGAVINMNSTVESPQGDVLKWTDMSTPTAAKGRAIGVGYYAYDWQNFVMYVNIGSNANAGDQSFGITGSTHFIGVDAGNSPARVNIHNLRLLGYSNVGIAVVQGANHWHLFNLQLYGLGGFYAQSNSTYLGSGISMSHNANNIEVDNCLIEQTYDSPLTPQFFSVGTFTLDTIHIHHNTLKYWALAAIEVSDFEPAGNTMSNFTFEYNYATGGGNGFSGSGHSPGQVAGILFRGVNASWTNIVVQHNTIQTSDGNAIDIRNGSSTNPFTVDDNRCSNSTIGANNSASTVVHWNVTNSQFCVDGTPINPAVPGAGNTYSGNTTPGTECYTTPRTGEGVVFTGITASRVLVSPGGLIYGSNVIAPSRRTNFTGHYAAIQHFQQVNYSTVKIAGVPLFVPGLVGLLQRVMWKLMEPSKGVYDFSLIDQFLAVCANPILNGSPFAGSGANGKLQLIIMIEDKTYSGAPDPVGSSADYFPDYLFNEGHTTARSTGGNPKSVTYRWQAYVADRYNQLVTAMYNWRSATTPNGFDAHPNFEGIAIQETAIGIANVDLDALGYTVNQYRDAYISMIGHIDQTFVKSKCFWFMNYMAEGQDRIGQVLDYMVASTDGAVFGGPDVLHNDSSLSNIPISAYSFYTTYKNQLDAFGSMQQNSFREINPAGTPAYYYTMDQQYDLAISINGEVTVSGNGGAGWSLFTKRVIWNFEFIGTDVPLSYNWSDAANIISNNYGYNAVAITKV